jgi:transcriptional regulator with XRE-family HTH domain
MEPKFRFTPSQAAPAPAFGQSAVNAEVERRRQAVADVDTYALGVENNHSFTQLVDMRRINSAGVDSDWVPPDGWSDQWVKAGIPTEWASEVVPGLRSQAQFEQALSVYSERAKRLETISDAGSRGFWGNLTSYMSDPAAFAVDGALSMVGGLGAGRKLNKLRQAMSVGTEVSPSVIRSLERTRVAQAGAAAGAGSAAAGLLTSQADPEYSGADVAFDFVFGAAIGSALEGVGVFFDRRSTDRMIADVNRTRSRPGDVDPDLGDIDALFPGAGRRPAAQPAATPGAPPAAARSIDRTLLSDFDKKIASLESLASGRVDPPRLREMEAELVALKAQTPSVSAVPGAVSQPAARSSNDLQAILDNPRTPGRQKAKARKELAALTGGETRGVPDAPAASPRIAELEAAITSARGAEEAGAELDAIHARLAGDGGLEEVATATVRPTGTFGSDTASAARRGDQVDASTNALGEATGRAYAAASETLTNLLNRASNTKAGQKLANALGVNRPTGDDLYVTEKNTIGGVERERLAQREAEQEGITGRYLGAREGIFMVDISTILRGAKDETARQIGRDLVSDSVQAMERGPDGVLRPTVNRVAAEDLQTVEYQRVYGEYRRAYEAAVKKLAERDKAAISAWEKSKRFVRRSVSTDWRVAVGERVGLVLRGNTDPDPIINELAAIGRRLFDDSLDVMRRAGVQGADIEGLKDFLPRVHRRNLRDFLAERLRGSTEAADDIVENLLEKAIASAFSKMGRPPNIFITRTVARAYTQRLLKRGDVDIGGLKTGVADMEEIAELLAEGGVDADTRAKILDYFESKSPDTSAETISANRLKHRVPMDETVSVETPDGQTLHISDLFENDVEVLAQRYAWEAAGYAALAKQGYQNAKALDAIIDDLKMQHRVTEREYEALKMAQNHILGRPLEKDPDGTISKAARTLGKFNFVTQMGSAWLSMGPEAAAIVAATGVRAVSKQIPAFGEILKQVATGELNSPLARELAVLGNPGSSLINNPVSTRADDYGMRGIEGRKFARGLDNALATAGRATAIFGGLGSVQDVLQVLFSRSYAQNLFDMAQDGRKYTKAEMERFMDYGMAPEDISALRKHLKEHAVADPSGVLREVNLAKMDPALQEKVAVMFHRATRHVVLEESIGQSLPFMNKMFGKMAFQFRRHQMLTWNRRMLHGMARKDTVAATTFIYGMMVAGAATYARAYINSPEGSKQREVVNDPYKLMKAAFAGTGEATIIPMMVDTFTTVIGNSDPVFNNYHRSSGLGSDFMSGNPTIATFDRVGRALGIPAAVLSSKQNVTEEDVRAMFALMPGSTLVGVQRLVKAAAAEFPKERDEMRRQEIEEGVQ